MRGRKIGIMMMILMRMMMSFWSGAKVSLVLGLKFQYTMISKNKIPIMRKTIEKKEEQDLIANQDMELEIILVTSIWTILLIMKLLDL